MVEFQEAERREQLVEVLRQLGRSRPDIIGLAGDLISTVISKEHGAAAAGTKAAGVTTIFGSGTTGGALGGIFVAATPVGWVVGAGLAGGALAYGVSRLVRSGEAVDQTRKNIYQRLKAKLKPGVEPHLSVAEEVPVEQYEIADKDAYYEFIESLRTAVAAKQIAPQRAERLLAAVTAGNLPVTEAMALSTHGGAGEISEQNTGQTAEAIIEVSADASVKNSFDRWLTLDAYRDLLKSVVNSEADPELGQLDAYLREHVPSVWLLGKTGAGKSSLVAEITNQSDVEIGNGFEPCTGGIVRYQYPKLQPIMEFLDTRGLSEVGYVADEDIDEASGHAHAIIAVVKIDDPEQSAVLETLSKLGKAKREHVLVVYTASHGMQDEQEAQRALNHIHRSFTQQLKVDLPYVQVDFPARKNVDQLREQLAQLMPSAELFLRKAAASNHEERVYLNQRERILWHAGAAGSADFVPGVGLVAVPAIQVKMLYQLSEAYELNWERQEVMEFIATLGTSFSIAYGSRVLVTQLGRLIPVWGQTIGQATAVAVSFGLTYALGRAACFYMYQKRHGKAVDPEQLKSIYKQALKRENLGLQAEESA